MTTLASPTESGIMPSSGVHVPLPEIDLPDLDKTKSVDAELPNLENEASCEKENCVANGTDVTLNAQIDTNLGGSKPPSCPLKMHEISDQTDMFLKNNSSQKRSRFVYETDSCTENHSPAKVAKTEMKNSVEFVPNGSLSKSCGAGESQAHARDAAENSADVQPNADTGDSNAASEKSNPLSIDVELKNSFKDIITGAVLKVSGQSELTSPVLGVEHCDVEPQVSPFSKPPEPDRVADCNDRETGLSDSENDLLNGVDCEFSDMDDDGLLDETKSANFSVVKNSISSIIESRVLEDSQSSNLTDASVKDSADSQYESSAESVENQCETDFHERQNPSPNATERESQNSAKFKSDNSDSVLGGGNDLCYEKLTDSIVTENNPVSSGNAKNGDACSGDDVMSCGNNDESVTSHRSRSPNEIQNSGKSSSLVQSSKTEDSHLERDSTLSTDLETTNNSPCNQSESSIPVDTTIDKQRFCDGLESSTANEFGTSELCLKENLSCNEPSSADKAAVQNTEDDHFSVDGKNVDCVDKSIQHSKAPVDDSTHLSVNDSHDARDDKVSGAPNDCEANEIYPVSTVEVKKEQEICDVDAKQDHCDETSERAVDNSSEVQVISSDEVESKSNCEIVSLNTTQESDLVTDESSAVYIESKTTTDSECVVIDNEAAKPQGKPQESNGQDCKADGVEDVDAREAKVADGGAETITGASNADSRTDLLQSVSVTEANQQPCCVEKKVDENLSALDTEADIARVKTDKQFNDSASETEEAPRTETETLKHTTDTKPQGGMVSDMEYTPVGIAGAKAEEVDTVVDSKIDHASLLGTDERSADSEDTGLLKTGNLELPGVPESAEVATEVPSAISAEVSAKVPAEVSTEISAEEPAEVPSKVPAELSIKASSEHATPAAHSSDSRTEPGDPVAEADVAEEGSSNDSCALKRCANSPPESYSVGKKSRLESVVGGLMSRLGKKSIDEVPSASEIDVSVEESEEEAEGPMITANQKRINSIMKRMLDEYVREREENMNTKTERILAEVERLKVKLASTEEELKIEQSQRRSGRVTRRDVDTQVDVKEIALAKPSTTASTPNSSPHIAALVSKTQAATPSPRVTPTAAGKQCGVKQSSSNATVRQMLNEKRKTSSSTSPITTSPVVDLTEDDEKPSPTSQASHTPTTTVTSQPTATVLNHTGVPGAVRPGTYFLQTGPAGNAVLVPSAVTTPGQVLLNNSSIPSTPVLLQKQVPLQPAQVTPSPQVANSQPVKTTARKRTAPRKNPSPDRTASPDVICTPELNSQAPTKTTARKRTGARRNPSPEKRKASAAAERSPSPDIVITTVTTPAPAKQHPAPLPPQPTSQASGPHMKQLPPKPQLKISRVNQGIVLSWNMTMSEETDEISAYQLFAYQESSAMPSPNLWKKVGDVKALALPMACTLTQFQEGNKYHFAVRATDKHKRVGSFSDPCSIHLK